MGGKCLKVMEAHLSNNRIALYLASYSGGGAEREVIYLANEFSSRGYIVDLLVHRDSGPLKSLVGTEVNQIIIDKSYLRDIFVIARYMRVNKPKFILSTLHIPNWALSIGKFISLTNTKITWRIVISLSQSMKFNKSKITYFYKLFYPILALNVNKIICVSNGVAQDLEANFLIRKDKIEVMYNPAYTPTLHNLAKESFEHKWFSDDFKTVVSLGRLSKQKDYGSLIRAFKLVHDEIDNSRLVIFGSGALESELQNLIFELGLDYVVELFGFELNPYKFLAKSDLFVISSIYEGFGNVIVEALALDIPVVSTDCPSGPAEILDNGRWGKLVPTGNSAILARVMLDSLGIQTKQETLPRAKEFSVERVADGYLRLME